MVKVQKNRFFREEFRKFTKHILIPIGIIITLVVIFVNSNYKINVSDSLPRGIYKTYEINREIKEGDIVLFKPNKKLKEIFTKVKYQDLELVPFLMKKVIGVPGDEFEYEKNKVIKNKKQVIGHIRERDYLNNPLPLYGECKLSNEEFYVIGTHPKSFDSKFYGPIKREDILKFAKPVLTTK